MTDALKLGVTPPIRDSGDVVGTPGVELIGPKGSVKLDKGLIIAKRHIHMLPEEAQRYGVKDKDLVAVFCDTKGRKAILMDVLIRVNPTYALEFHVDTDESNAAMLKTGDLVHIVEL
jgi:putative phosphotransacetylase